jgi:hypothetical protein
LRREGLGYCGVLVEMRGLRYRGETGRELIFSTGEEGKREKGLRPQGSNQIECPAKGAPGRHMSSVKIQVGGRANGKDCFLRRGTFGIGETAGVSACVCKGTVETQRKSTGLGLYQTESDTEFGFWEAHPCSYLSDEGRCCFTSISGEKP